MRGVAYSHNYEYVMRSEVNVGAVCEVRGHTECAWGSDVIVAFHNDAIDAFHDAIDAFHDTFHDAIDAFHDAINAFHDASVGTQINKSPLFLHFSSFEHKPQREQQVYYRYG